MFFWVWCFVWWWGLVKICWVVVLVCFRLGVIGGIFGMLSSLRILGWFLLWFGFVCFDFLVLLCIFGWFFLCGGFGVGGWCWRMLWVWSWEESVGLVFWVFFEVCERFFFGFKVVCWVKVCRVGEDSCCFYCCRVFGLILCFLLGLIFWIVLFGIWGWCFVRRCRFGFRVSVMVCFLFVIFLFVLGIMCCWCLRICGFFIILLICCLIVVLRLGIRNLIICWFCWSFIRFIIWILLFLLSLCLGI